jgi:cytochrome c-type biogenesis protein
MNVTLWLAFIAGLISFLSPCVLPLVPAYIGYMGGRVANTVAAQTGGGISGSVRPTFASRVSTITHGLTFVAGFTFVFVVLGLLTNLTLVRIIGGQNVTLVRDIIARVGGILIIFFGLHFTGIVPSLLRRLLVNQPLIGTVIFSLAFALVAGAIFLWAFVDWLIGIPVLLLLILWLVLGGAFVHPARFWTRTIETLQNLLYADTRRQMVARGQQSYSSSAIMGVVFAAGWTPCIGPIYGSILTLASVGGEMGQAAVLMVAYSLGLGVPFLLAALLLDGAQSLIRKTQRHLHKVEMFSGAFLIVIGILVATGSLQNLSQNFASQFADLSTRLDSCVISATQGEIPFGELPGCITAPSAAEPTGTTLLPDSSAF